MSTPTPPPLRPDRVDVWRLLLPDATPAALTPFLVEPERKRAARFVFEKDRACYVAARGTLRRLLGHYLGHSPDAVQLASGPQGKPELAAAHESRIRFNVSHSGTLALLAFTLDEEVGVDIERGHDHFDLLELAQTVFAPVERARLAAAAPAERRELFYRHWVAKEAYIKALGGGLSIPLEAFGVAFESSAPGGAFTIATAEGTSPVQGVWLDAPAGYAAAVARQGTDWSVRTHDAAPAGEPTG